MDWQGAPWSAFTPQSPLLSQSSLCSVHCGHGWNSTSCGTRVKSSSGFVFVPRVPCYFGWLDVCGFAAHSYQFSFHAGSRHEGSACVLQYLSCALLFIKKKKKKRKKKKKSFQLNTSGGRKRLKIRHPPIMIFLSPYPKKAHKGNTLELCSGLRSPGRLVVILLWLSGCDQHCIRLLKLLWNKN